MGWSLSLGSISGIKVRIHVTFLLFLGWIGLSSWQSEGSEAAVQSVLFMVALFACVVAHEFGHIFMARRFGCDTQDVVLLPIGGVARMKRLPEKPVQELLVALAGPAVNVVIGGILVAVHGPEALSEVLSGRGEWPMWAELAVANGVLAVFNLLPAFPMDGGRALRALLALRMGRAPATDLATRIGHVLSVGVGVYGLVSGQPMLMLVAMFIYMGASAENAATQAHAAAAPLRVADAMMTHISCLPADATLAEAVEVLSHTAQHDIPLVDAMGKPVGLVTRGLLARALHSHGAGHRALEAMRDDIPLLRPEASLDEAMERMEATGAPAVFVVDAHGALAGMVSLENLGQLLMFSRLSRR